MSAVAGVAATRFNTRAVRIRRPAAGVTHGDFSSSTLA